MHPTSPERSWYLPEIQMPAKTVWILASLSGVLGFWIGQSARRYSFEPGVWMLVTLAVASLCTPAFRYLWPILLAHPACAAARALAIEISHGTGPLTSFRNGVGGEAYTGLSKALEYRSYFATLGLFLALGILAFLIQRRIARGRAKPLFLADPMPQFSWGFCAAVSLTLFLSLFPRVADVLPEFDSLLPSVGWDWANGFTWTYTAHRGLLAFKDIWFPYGGAYAHMGPFPAPVIAFSIHKMIVFAAFSLAVYSIVQRGKAWTVAILLSTVLLVESGYVTPAYRYFVAFDIVLLFLALEQTQATSLRAFVAYGAFVSWAFWFEPNQVAYAFPSCAVLSVLYTFRRSPTERRSLWVRYLAVLVTVAIGVGAYLAYLGIQGQLPGFIEFCRGMGNMADHSEFPSQPHSWFKLDLAPEPFAYIFLHFFVGYGIYLVLAGGRWVNHEGGDLLFSIGLLTAFVMVKQIVRCHIAAQFLLYLIVGTLLFVARESRRWNFSQKTLAALFLGFCVSASIRTDALFHTWVNYPGKVHTLIRQIEPIFWSSAKWEEMAKRYFSVDRVPGLSSEMRDFLRDAEGSKNSDSDSAFYVLGDESFLYAVANQKPPFFITYYDGAGVDAQRKTLAWLKQNDPKWVVWDPNFAEFDAVPNVVRAPLVFRYVIENYVPHRTIQNFQILQKRAPEVPIAEGFWRRHLKTPVALEAIPSRTSFAELKSCNDGVECHDFLLVEGQASAQKKTMSVPIQVGDARYEVSFLLRDSSNPYVIDLHRLWFWPANAGTQVAIPEIPGVHLRREKRAVPPDILY